MHGIVAARSPYVRGDNRRGKAERMVREKTVPMPGLKAVEEVVVWVVQEDPCQHKGTPEEEGG